MDKSPPQSSLWADEYHYIRRASAKDPHVMRFVLAPYREGTGLKQRHVPSIEEGVALAQRATKRAGGTNTVVKFSRRAVPVSLQPVAKGKAKKEPPQAWASTRFNCIRANAVAQVWLCIKAAEAMRPLGRKRKDGSKAPAKKQLRHLVNECAVMHLGEPVREEDGTIKVFTVVEADNLSRELYYAADEDDQSEFGLDKPAIERTTNLIIYYVPDEQGLHEPFYLYKEAHGEPIYANTTKSLAEFTYSRKQLIESQRFSEQQVREIEELRRQAKHHDRVDSLTTERMRFRSFDAAKAYGWWIEGYYFDNKYLGGPMSRAGAFS